VTEKRVRHILGLSGGKDSAALAIYMRDKIPDMEYFFCDTGKELPEVYEYLYRLETILGCEIVRLQRSGRDFDHYLTVYRHYLPSPTSRWCTRHLKIEPMEEFVGDDEAYSYVAIRADEDRQGYLSTKPNIKPIFPFIEHGLTISDVIRILDKTGLGMPKYYEWRSRSGCYFCFFQRKIEWVRLLQIHPELYELAMKYEKIDPTTGQRYTWNEGESLEELARPERIQEILDAAGVDNAGEAEEKRMSLVQVLGRWDTA
jgi:3'-phosphoadenosine 5'-phosphosulfate sulfotransferase (PAPS reductase)/FAD synthetase